MAVATKGLKSLEDEVSDVFGRARAFAIVETEGGQIKNAKAVENPAASYEYGAGPIVTKMLADMGVEVVIAGEFGMGVSVLLKDKNIRAVKVRAGTNVCRAVDSELSEKQTSERLSCG
ncbi:MAG: NifB/NifX family molybdenum-iron cluster-binding protein [Candidatus Hodarchaeaceae archaeon]|nr:NifB/NifX family molybdenum-iron cluster-binding protein [Candidatus Hodarchaeaceae archaeon]